MNRIAASHLEETVFVLFSQHLWLESSDGVVTCSDEIICDIIGFLKTCIFQCYR